MKTTVALFVAAIVGVTAFAQDTTVIQEMQAQEWPDNDFTNRIVVTTVEAYTNSQAAIAADQQNRVAQEGTVTKGASRMVTGPRIAPRPPTAFLQPDPWVEQDHPWDVQPSSPYSPSLTPAVTNNTVEPPVPGKN